MLRLPTSLAALELSLLSPPDMDPLAYIEVRNVLTVLPRTRHNGSTVFSNNHRTRGEWLTARARALEASWNAASEAQHEHFGREMRAVAAQLEAEHTRASYDMDEHLPRVETMRGWLEVHPSVQEASSSSAHVPMIRYGGEFLALIGVDDAGNDATPTNDKKTLERLLDSVKSTDSSGEYILHNRSAMRQWRTSAVEALTAVWSTARAEQRSEFRRRLLRLDERLQTGRITRPADLPSLSLMHDLLLPPPPPHQPPCTAGGPPMHPWNSLAKSPRAGNGRRSASRYGDRRQQGDGEEASPFWPVRRSGQ